MKNYISPRIESFSSIDLTESIGPVQMQSLSFDVYRGTYLQQEKEYRYCELKNNTMESFKIYNINKEEIENA